MRDVVFQTQSFKFNNESVELPVIEGSKDVFISYKRENAPYVARLFEELGEHHIDAWFDMNELHHDVGNEYTERIHKGIDKSEFFLMIYTKEVESSKFIINEELEYAVKKNKTILFYPKDEINIGKSKLKKYVEKIQWLDTQASAIHQQDTIESIKGEKKLASLSALINEKHGQSVYEDMSLFLIRIALQRKLGKNTVFGNYRKLCGTGANEFYSTQNFNMCVINKALFIDVPEKFKKKLQELKFFREDKVKEIRKHREALNPESSELMQQFYCFLDAHKYMYSMPVLHERLSEYLNVDKYKDIILPSLDNFDKKQMQELLYKSECEFEEAAHQRGKHRAERHCRILQPG